MRVRPVRLNTTVASLFVVGSACFVLGSVPWYAEAAGAEADSATYFVGSVFFTSASFGQLLQAQTRAMTEVDEVSQHVPAQVLFWSWLPQDRGWLAAATQFPGTLFFNLSTAAALVHNLTVEQQDKHVWRPDFFGSTLFLVSSAYAIVALGQGFLAFHPSSTPCRIAWLNMVGSLFFMASALASYVLPTTGQLIDSWWAITGTLLGAICFLVGAALMLPAWSRAVRAPGRAPT